MREKFDKFTLFKHLAKNIWQINRLANRLLIVSNIASYIATVATVVLASLKIVIIPYKGAS